MGSSPSVACKSTVWPLRQTFILALVSGAVDATMRGRSRSRPTSLPLNDKMTSPCLRPAFAPGLFGVTTATKCPVLAFQPEACGYRRRHFLNLHAEPTAADLAVLLELRDHGFGDIGRNRKADPDTAAIGRIDRRIDADHLAIEIEGRSAGVAAIDRCVDLQEIIEWAGMNVPAARRDDPGGDGPAQPEGVADGHDPVADLGRAAVAEGDIGQRLVGLDLAGPQYRSWDRGR